MRLRLKETLKVKTEQYNAQLKKWNAYKDSLKAKIQRLMKFEGIADADEKASAMLREANAALDDGYARAAQAKTQAEEQATATICGAEEEAEKITSEAKQKAKELKDNAQEALESTTAT
ncbi:hypothetical protein GOV10_05550, partial [Candidatus Woesearchaeota archaeon]|nr:hypothetical protein [Candidatus Woesearchaeota archaeon]